MCGLLRTGVQQLDTLRGAQMAAQEASGVMAVAMLRQQGEMREVSAWELEVEGVMREIVRRVEGRQCNGFYFSPLTLYYPGYGSAFDMSNT